MSTLQSETKTNRVTTAIVRFAGDSGDGMQLAGMQFTKATGIAGNDLMTFPDFPAEIRAPQGTIPGVSGFQIHFGSDHVHTPGDRVDVLVAMNPAALKANLKGRRGKPVNALAHGPRHCHKWERPARTAARSCSPPLLR